MSKAPYTKPRLARLERTPELERALAPAAELRVLNIVRATSSDTNGFGYELVRAERQRQSQPERVIDPGSRRAPLQLLLAMLVAFVLGVLASLVSGCGRVGYEGDDTDAGAIVDTWEREGGNGSCDESFTFNADSSFAWLMVCRNGTVQRVVGSYELAGDLVRFKPVDSCTPPYNRQWAAVWKVSDYVLELNGGSYYRGELADDTEPAELCP